MISYSYNYPFSLIREDQYSEWIKSVIEVEGFELGDLSYAFLGDEELLKLNQEYLDHDTLTDIISFDYTVGKVIQGEVFISVERVKENAEKFGVDFNSELSRVMIHGVLHYCGYKDKTEQEKMVMRQKEDFYIALLNR